MPVMPGRSFLPPAWNTTPRQIEGTAGLGCRITLSPFSSLKVSVGKSWARATPAERTAARAKSMAAPAMGANETRRFIESSRLCMRG